MAIVRLESLRCLKDAIVASVPELGRDSLGRERVVIGAQAPAKTLLLPTLVIDPVRFRYIPDAEYDVHEPDPAHVVLNVGRWEATVQLRLAAATPEKRMELEEKVLNAFLETEGHPGVLLTQVTACRDLGPFMAAWELDSDEWQDEKVFSQQLWSNMSVLGQLPALITRGGVARITDLRLGLDEDFGATVDPTSFDVDPAGNVHVVRVNQDGTVTKLS